MVLLAEHLVGRAEELGSLEQVHGELDQGRATAIELVGGARDRQDAAAQRACGSRAATRPSCRRGLGIRA
jgi:hypothetical protein